MFLKRWAGCILAGLIFFGGIYIDALAETVSGDMISGKQGENGWYYQMMHDNFFYFMPKYSENVTPTWRSGQDYPYVDGNCSFENILKMKKAGDDIFVAGTSSVFNPEIGIEKAMDMIIEILK